MTPEEIIDAARESGFGGMVDDSNVHPALQRFAAIIAAKQREKMKCWCQTCRPITMDDMRFVVCPECGNKRCPKANDHRHACTNSNEPGQPGSAYKNITDAIRGQQ